MAATTRSAATLKTWLLRALITVVVGLAIGAGGGVIGVRTLEPGKPEQADSLQLMLDSIAKHPQKTVSDVQNPPRVSDSVIAAARMQQIVDSVQAAQTLATQTPPAEPVIRPDAVTVPSVIGLEEGKARQQLLDNHLVIGTVEFEASTAAAGTVLRTTPAAGDAIRLNGSVSLVLSNGRTPSRIETVR